jgi:uncharacterized RDD family membrane protein YckC
MLKARTYSPHETARMKVLEGAPLASFRSRALAFFLDFVLFGVLFLVAILAVAKVCNHFGLFKDKNIHIELNFFHNWYSVVYLVVCFGISLYIGRGQTLGKKIFRIRVVSLVHRHLSFWHCIERALGYGASVLEFGFGFAQYFIHPNRRTVHDRIAETIVIKVPRN